ncbi:GTPase domain-containing protein [Sanguibacter suaedae]|uniref:ABC transporter n=1 Tax=Sanguibacter suaedae TaxID=2795737 RepID=A0A934I8G6_9MICO|nr:GTPase domain-containing protein [Sanguibacter suaedae]MBI9115067.1 ABC transporter [Sanguibacter suaedae]
MPDGARAPARPGDAVLDGVAGLVRALRDLRAHVEATRFSLETVSAPRARRERAAVLDQLDDYLLPRLEAQGAPLLAVVGGSTGAGKSTLVNSLLGQHVTIPGALRPTTRSPVLVHHPDDAVWFDSSRVFPHLAREVPGSGPVPPPPSSGSAVPAGSRTADEPARSLRLVANEALPPGLALLDAPDVDSVVVGNRELAAQLLAAADLWVFVTTASRYADAVPWDMLHDAAGRRAQVAIVVDRVDPGAEVVRDHLRGMLAEHGLASAPVFLVPESTLVDGMLPESAVAPLSRWLTDVGGDATARDAVISATRDGVVDDLAGRAMSVADAAESQTHTEASLRSSVVATHAEALDEVTDALSDGSLLRGEVLARWQDFVGTGDLMRSVETKVGVLRDRVTGFFRGRPAAAPRVVQAVSSSLEAIVHDAVDRAAGRTYREWSLDPAGVALLGGLELSRASADLRPELAAQVRAWQADVLALVADRGADKRGRARLLAVGVNGLGAALMVVVFAQTGGLTGAEVGIAGGSAVLAQRLLEAVFGDEAVRSLARDAQTALLARVSTVLAGHAARYTDRLDALELPQDAGRHVRLAAQAVQVAASRERDGRAPVTRPADEDRTGRTGALRGATLDVVDDPYGPAGTATSGDVPDGSPRRGLWRRLLGKADR